MRKHHGIFYNIELPNVDHLMILGTVRLGHELLLPLPLPLSLRLFSDDDRLGDDDEMLDDDELLDDDDEDDEGFGLLEDEASPAGSAGVVAVAEGVADALAAALALTLALDLALAFPVALPRDFFPVGPGSSTPSIVSNSSSSKRNAGGSSRGRLLSMRWAAGNSSSQSGISWRMWCLCRS